VLVQAAEVLPPTVPTILSDQVTPVDLASAFRLAGVENPQIQIAIQQVSEALAIRQLAAAQILPNINGGTNYNNHTGNLQRSDGSILAVNRSALYGGAGAFAVGSGTVNIPGVVWNMNLSEAAFSILRTRQLVQERQFASLATRNDMLLQVAVAYLELLRAEEARAIAVSIRNDAGEVARLTANYAATGQGRQADADRAATELRQREADVLATESDVLTIAARLGQLLNIDPSVRLHPVDGWAVPKAIVPGAISLPELIATALMQRPELAERRAAIQRAILDLNAAKMLPFSPNVIVGFSAGTFGGGSNLVTPTFGDFAARSDFDTVAYWSLRNLAVGNRALINAAAARYSVSNLEQIAVLNRVRSEVASAYARTQARYAQISINEAAVKTGQDGFREDLIRIRGREGLPIEVLNSLRLLARARMEYLTAIIEYNRAEFELYVALGQPPANALARPLPSPHTINPNPANP
jgi:outer membrane protein TolC